MKNKHSLTWLIGHYTMVALLLIAAPGLAAKGGVPGPPVGGETANNLSFPALLTESQTTILAYWTPAITSSTSSRCCSTSGFRMFGMKNFPKLLMTPGIKNTPG